MYKVSICGHFGGNEKYFDGQTVKTKNIYNELLCRYKKEEIGIVDTYNWKKHPIRLFMNCIRIMKKSKNLIILPAHNGIKVFIPLFVNLNRIYKRKVFYIVIGGWLPELLQGKKYLIRKIKMLDKIFVETNKMKHKLVNLEINNVDILVNFKKITPLTEEKLNYDFDKPYKICTFSRVMKEKGIEDVVEAIKQINKEADEIIYKLDIYGPIDTKYIEQFKKIEEGFPQYIQYKGCVDSNKSIDTLKKYYLLVFPTRFKSEGIPSTIIDAFASGTPVIASRWDNFEEVIKEGYNGFGYEFGSQKDLILKLKECSNNERILKLKKNCILTANIYNPKKAIQKLIMELE